MANLLPVEKLAVKVGGWGVLALLAFFFPVVGFIAVFTVAANHMLMFMFVHENTKGFPYDNESNPARYYQPYLPTLGANWERSVRTNLPESDA